MKRPAYHALTWAIPLLVLAAVLCAMLHGYMAAFVLMLLAFASVEMRVRMGYRLPRGLFFALHLSCGIPALLALGFLAFWKQPVWLVTLFWIPFLVSLSSGSLLFVKGVRAFATRR